MAVREKTLTRSPAAVKHLATGSTRLASAHNVSRMPHLLLDCGGLAAAFKPSTPPQVQPPTQGRTASHESQVTSHESRVTSSNTCHTRPKSDSIDPPNASPHETRAAPADKPPTPSPLHTSSAPDIAPGSAPADQPYPHRPAAPASASSHSSNAQTASCSRIPPAAPTAHRKTIHPQPDAPPSQIPRSGSPSPRPRPPP